MANSISEVLKNKNTNSYRTNYSTIEVNKVNTIVSYPIVATNTEFINPIQAQAFKNDPSTVDALIQECSELIDARFKPWFLKRFYYLDKSSVLAGASLAKQDGRNPQSFFSHLVKSVVV